MSLPLSGNCYCDAACKGQVPPDCCPDYDYQCLVPPLPPPSGNTCFGRCGFFRSRVDDEGEAFGGAEGDDDESKEAEGEEEDKEDEGKDRSRGRTRGLLEGGAGRSRRRRGSRGEGMEEGLVVAPLLEVVGLYERGSEEELTLRARRANLEHQRRARAKGRSGVPNASETRMTNRY